MPVKPAIDAQQLNKLVRTLKRAGQEDLLAALKEANAESAKDIENTARPLAPQRSGKLVASLRSSATARTGTVRVGRASLPYAGPIHFGWPSRPNAARGWRGGPIAPNPFLYEAIDRRYNEVVQVYMDRIMKVCESIADAGT